MPRGNHAEDHDLRDLECRVRAHLDDRSVGLRTLGQGEICVVVAWPEASPAWACKRLPPLADHVAVDRHRDLMQRYVDLLAQRGVTVAPSRYQDVRVRDQHVLYVVQPLYPPEDLAVTVLRRTAPPAVPPVVDAVLDAVDRIDDAVGIDAQLSNWVWHQGDAVYLDTSTPFVREGGVPALDLTLVLAPFPALVRPAMRRWVAPALLHRYHDRRAVAVDLVANLHRERLQPWIDPILDRIGDRFGAPITRDEVDSYYRTDARLWNAVQAMKRAQRAWQERVRRTPYPFLLPERIDR